MRLDIAAAVIGALALAPRLGAQVAGGDPKPSPPPAAPAGSATRHGSAGARTPVEPHRLSNAGVYRAAAQVDSVYVDRVNRQAFVPGGDFASYLVARLGVRPVPDDLAIDVGVDPGAVTLSSQIRQLPPAVRAALGPALMLFNPESVVAADVALMRDQPGVVRFHLRSLLVDGNPIPEMLVGPLMAQLGARYPKLTSTGRDLLVSIPADGTMRLEQGGVRVGIRSTPASPKPKS